MTEPFDLRRRTPAGQLRYLAEQLAATNGLDPDNRVRLAAVQLQLEQLADELDANPIRSTPICGDVFQSGITDRAQGPCLKPPGHAPADPWHQDNTGCRWRLAEDAPDVFRWHVLSQCEDETACPIHGRNEGEPTGPEDGADRYLAMVNAPLTEQQAETLAADLLAGRVKRRKGRILHPGAVDGGSDVSGGP